MKIVCDACGAKYSVADEKVAGKVFKIRCKKCSEAIIVRGDQQQGQPAAAQAPDDAPWHVVIEGEQQGPLSVDQLIAMVQATQIDLDSYVWREGFEGWQAIRDVAELQQALSPYAQQPAAPANVAAESDGLAGFSAEDEELATVVAPMGALSYGLAADAAAEPNAEPQASVTEHSAHAAGADLFAATPGPSVDQAAPAPQVSAPGRTAAFDESSPEPTPGPVDYANALSSAEQEDPAANLTGVRNENSVLFSLANLKSLGTTASPSSSDPSQAPAADTSSGATTAEGGGSGLIDIRALASSAEQVDSQRKDHSANVVLPVASRAAPFAGSLTAPSLSPKKKDTNKLLVAAIALLAIGLVATAAVLIVYISKDKEQPALATAPPVAGDPGVPPAQAETPQQGQEPTATPTTEQNAVEDIDEPTPSGSKSSKSSKSSSKSKSGRSKSGKSSSSEPSKSTKSKSSDSLDDLLNNAAKGSSSGSSKSSSSKSNANLPSSPSRSDVLGALKSVQGAVRACGNGKHGTASTTIKVKGSTGRVSSVSVKGPFAGTPVGSCVSRAVRKAKFPKFSKSSFTVNFPFSI